MISPLPVLSQTDRVNETVIAIIRPAEEKKPEPPKEPTLEEKIATNYYKCNTTTQWIWAQDASCHDKAPSIQQNTTTAPQNGSGGRFEWGWCTFFADQQRPDIHATGNAADWIRYANSKTPAIGSVAVNTQGLGHVAIVTAVDGNRVQVVHMNWRGFGVVSTDWVDASYWSGYIL